MNPYDLASDGLVQYTGDRNPLEYGGTWYDSSTWASDGYASAVRVDISGDGPDGGKLVYVSLIVANKPSSDERMKSALDCCGGTMGDTASEIEACLGYGLYDPDESDWREPSSYTFLIADNEGDDFSEYARIHGATESTNEELEELLNRLVGRELFQGRV